MSSVIFLYVAGLLNLTVRPKFVIYWVLLYCAMLYKSEFPPKRLNIGSCKQGDKTT